MVATVTLAAVPPLAGPSGRPPSAHPGAQGPQQNRHQCV